MTNALKTLMTRFRRCDEGATLVEYGIALTIAVTVGATALFTLSGSTSAKFDAANTAMTQTSGSGS